MMRVIAAAVLLAAIALLSGCTGATELGSRAIIQVAAVDYSDDEYTVHALLFSGGGKDGIDVSKDNVVKVSGRGKTLTEAVKQISLACGKEIYMAETKLLVIGSGFENTSVMPVAETLYYDMRCSLNMPLCCADSAELLTDVRFLEGVTSAEKPVEIIRTAHSIGTSPYTTLMDVLRDNEGGRSTLIAYFEEGYNGSGLTSDTDGKTALLGGSRLLKGGKLSGSFDEVQTQGLLLLSGDRDKCYFSFNYGGREYSCEAYSVSVELLRGDEGISAEVTAKFRRENGAPLEGEALQTAQNVLNAIVANSLQLAS